MYRYTYYTASLTLDTPALVPFGISLCLSSLRAQRLVSDLDQHVFLQISHDVTKLSSMSFTSSISTHTVAMDTVVMVADRTETETVAPTWLDSPRAWGLCRDVLSAIPCFQFLPTSMVNHPSHWQLFLIRGPHVDLDWNAPGVVLADVPAPSPFQMFLFWLIFRPDLSATLWAEYFTVGLGSAGLPSPPCHDLAALVHASCSSRPMLFLLDPATEGGLHPLSSLLDLSLTHSKSANLSVVSLGVSETTPEVLMAMVREAALVGSWVLFENCHLASAKLLSHINHLCHLVRTGM